MTPDEPIIQPLTTPTTDRHTSLQPTYEDSVPPEDDEAPEDYEPS